MHAFFYRVLVFCITLLVCSLPGVAGFGFAAGADRQPTIAPLIPGTGALSPGLRIELTKIIQRAVPPGLDLKIPENIRVNDCGSNARYRSRILSGLADLPTTIIDEFWDDGLSAWVNLGKTELTYDGSDRLIESVYSFWNGSDWDPGYRNTNTYDGSGNRTGELQESWNGSMWVSAMRATNTYDGGGRLLTSLVESYNGSSWEGLYRWTKTYDGSGNLTEWIWEYWFFGSWVNNTRLLYTYDGSNRLTSFTYQSWTGSAWTNFRKTTSTYDGGGRLITDLVQMWSGSAWTDITLYTYTYDGSDRLTETLTQTWAGSWVDVSRESTTYDGSGNATEVLYETWNGSAWENSNRTNNTYDGSGNLTVSVYQFWDMGAWVNQSRTTYSYSGATAVEGDGRPAGEFMLADNYPNPFNPSTEIGYAVSEKTLVRLTIHDLLGREVGVLVGETLPPGSYSARWNAVNLPAGVYFYRLETGVFRETKKMVLLK